MEGLPIPAFGPAWLVTPPPEKSRSSVKIGVVKEIKNHEYRVALRPSGAEQLIADGHEVMVETLAGKGTSLGDDLYESDSDVVLS